MNFSQAQRLQGRLKRRVGVAQIGFELLELWTAERIEQLFALTLDSTPPPSHGLARASEFGQ